MRSPSVPTMTTLELTDERRAFVESIRDFCRRECGTREQRDGLTGGGEHHHNQDLYARMAELGWLGVAISEEHGGTGVGAVSCRAERSNGSYLVNGQKTWISNAREAAHVLLVCRTSREGSKHQGLTMLEIPQGADGMEIRPIDTMGGRETNDIFFTDCSVPADNLLGEEGRGWTQLMAGLNFERLIIAAQALGLARRAFDDALKFVGEREQFG